ncbi:hypothetical protein A9Q83_13655 [Alphaproteobacteria bacterium 46_93_T64]|nr:hypothetical protein A9Q83_13655 [Alphaproteobacteria bacterium 46_93_T64]
MSFLRGGDVFENIRQTISNQVLGRNASLSFLEKLKKPKNLVNLLSLRGLVFKKKEEEKIRQFLADLFAGEIIEIADNATKEDPSENMKSDTREVVARAKLRIDTRKWLMEHFSPSFYGNTKVEKENKGPSSLFRAKVYLPENGRP